MAILKNPYAGINPHLNSLLQTSGTEEQPSLWPGFHAAHIVNLMEGLNGELPTNYIAISEHSLQSRGQNIDGGLIVSRPQPDVTIFQQSESVALAEKVATKPAWQVTIEEAIDPEDLMTAVVVRKLSGQSTLGTPVLRIELLSPSNKPGGRHYSAYRSRRIEAIESNIPLVEIDYLHESVSPIVGLPHYPDNENSYPYYIAIHDNRPTWQDGFTKVYGISIEQALPTLLLPLDSKNAIQFDFDPPYQHTYERGRWGQLVRMDKHPIRFNTYNSTDREIIEAKMATIVQIE
ncbi:MAG: DUF4058 family protein [Anaerolineae bacterium]|nr:DUF4058 family protein [Anaerolineae bacterium]